MIATQRGEGEGGGGVHLGFDLHTFSSAVLSLVGRALSGPCSHSNDDRLVMCSGRSRSLLSRSNHWPGTIARLTVSLCTLLLCLEGRGQESFKQYLSFRNQLAVWVDEISKILLKLSESVMATSEHMPLR